MTKQRGQALELHHDLVLMAIQEHESKAASKEGEGKEEGGDELALV